MKLIGFTAIFAIYVTLIDGGTPCDGSCRNEKKIATCKLMPLNKFNCKIQTRFNVAAGFNITACQRACNRQIWQQCSINSSIQGAVTFECPYDKNYTFFPVNVSISDLDSKNGDTIFVDFCLKNLFRPKKLSGIKIYAAENSGIRVLRARINQHPLLPTANKFVYVTFHSKNNFHEPKQYCRSVRNRINETFSGLHPYEEYVVKISWKKEDGDYCSPVTLETIRTRPSKPSAAPQLLKGSYSETTHSNRSALYWKTIPKYHENGPKLKYIIYMLPTHIMKNNYELLHNFTTLTNLSSVSPYFNISNLAQFQIATVDGSDDSVMLPLGLFPGDHILLRTNNSEGYSDEYSSVEVDVTEKNVVQHVVASQLNETHYELNWISTIDSTFTVQLYWCHGIYWSVPGWTECKHNISGMTIPSSELEQSASSLKLIKEMPASGQPAKTPESQPVALPPSYLHFGISVYYQDRYSHIVWNASKISLDSDQQGQAVMYTSIGLVVFVCILLLVICICSRHKIKKHLLKHYEITMPANFDQIDSENTAETPVLLTTIQNSDQVNDKERHDSGVGSLTSPSSCSSSESQQLVIPVAVSSTETISSATSSPEGAERKMSSSESTLNSSPIVACKDSTNDSLSSHYPSSTINSSEATNSSVPDSQPLNNLPALRLKPKSKPKSKAKLFADRNKLSDYSVASIQETRHLDSESEDSCSSVSSSRLKPIGTMLPNERYQQKQQKALSVNSDTPDNDCDVVDYPATSIVFRLETEEIMC